MDMAKIKKAFFCSECGAQSAKWIGKCPSCESWNTYNEEIISNETKQEKQRSSWDNNKEKVLPLNLAEIKSENTARITTHDQELNRVLGGGIVYGSLVLVAGQPGIGKSTLLLQIATSIKAKILYVSGEESAEQIKMRADRMKMNNNDCFILTEINISKILQTAEKMNPDILIVDSVQTLSSPFIESAPGSVSQIRECTAELQKFAKSRQIPTFIIGHITKEGSIAGPKLLEHIVDVVLQFEGDRNYTYRILRTLKNRFGSTDEIGIYEMMSNGLREVANPSELLLSQNEERLSGSAIASTIEGLRPMLIEAQALVTASVYGTPQRSATGYDAKRLNMLLAVLEKRCGLPFGQMDVFLNMAGGLRVSDPSIDLSVITALISSLENIYVNKHICFAGEVGLSGEIRSVSRIEQRIQEADRLGFETIYISKFNAKGIDQKKYNVEIKTIAKVDDLLSDIFA